MRRRDFIGLVGGATAWPLAVTWPSCSIAEGTGKVWRVGVLPGPRGSEGSANILERSLGDLGYVRDKNIVLVSQYSEPNPQSTEDAILSILPTSDLLVVAGTLGGVAAKKLVTTKPVIFVSVGAPVDIGLVESLSRPGGNLTGITFEASAETYAKRLQLLKEVMPELGIPVLDLEAKVIEMGNRLKERLTPDFDGFGLELVEVQVQDIGLPEEVEKAIDKRGAIAAVGNLAAYTQYETASAIRDAANNQGGAAGAAVGIGAGVAMGAQMANSMGNAMGLGGGGGGGGHAAPPPIPGGAAFHVAVGQSQTGPFDLGALGSQAASGQLTRNSLVWRAGMSGWVKAGEVPELSGLFANSPPPIPG